MVEIKEQMPAAGYRVLQSVTSGDEFPLTFLRMQVGKTTPVAATREAISLLGTTGLCPLYPIARGLARDRAEGGMQEPDSPRATAREEHRGYTRVDFSKKVRLRGSESSGSSKNPRNHRLDVEGGPDREDSASV